MFGEQVLVQERQFHSVADQFDLARQASDVAVVDVRDLFEDEFLDLGFGDLLENETGALIQ